jgi:hypothetical protein
MHKETSQMKRVLTLSPAAQDHDGVWIRQPDEAWRLNFGSETDPNDAGRLAAILHLSGANIQIGGNDDFGWYLTIREKGAPSIEVDYVSFGHAMLHAGLGQCQYVSRYVDGRNGHPNLGDGLRIQGNPSDYHRLTIHKDDVQPFIDRVVEHRSESNEAD